MKYTIFSNTLKTLYENSKDNSQNETIKDINKAKRKNIEFIICTDNPYTNNMKDLIKKLDTRYFIGSNGAFILDVKNNEIILSKEIDKNNSQTLLEKALSLDLKTIWWNKDNFRISNNFPKTLINELKTKLELDKIPKISNEINFKIHKMEVYGKKEKLDILSKELDKNIFSIIRMNDEFLSINSKDTNKESAIEYFLNHFSLELEKAMSIGNLYSDYGMLNLAKYSYSFSGKESKFYTSSFEQNGVGEAIIDFMFRNRLTENFDNQK